MHNLHREFSYTSEVLSGSQQTRSDQNVIMFRPTNSRVFAKGCSLFPQFPEQQRCRTKREV
jgi:hypothetical protein